jgi:crossover junction endodeoxyribonuclease RuvC
VRILGIDPGYGILGWAIIEKNQKLIDYGVIETRSGTPIGERILEIHYQLNEIILQYHPHSAGVEKLFFTKNLTTGLDVAKTIGATILTLKLNNISYAEYTPSQVKQAITGYGRAGKEQMMHMIKTIFNLKELPKRDDAADALAIALCHSLRQDHSL